MSEPVSPTGDLIALIPPRTSAWSMFGVYDFFEPYAQVKEAEGNHVLGWSLMGDTHALRIKFTLYKQDPSGLQPVKEMAVPAQPTFAVFHHMTRRFLDGEKKSAPRSRAGFAAASDSFDAHNETMREESDFLHELLTEWFEDSPALREMAGNLYIAVTADVSMQLTMPGWEPPAYN